MWWFVSYFLLSTYNNSISSYYDDVVEACPLLLLSAATPSFTASSTDMSHHQIMMSFSSLPSHPGIIRTGLRASAVPSCFHSIAVSPWTIVNLPLLSTITILQEPPFPIETIVGFVVVTPNCSHPTKCTVGSSNSKVVPSKVI